MTKAIDLSAQIFGLDYAKEKASDIKKDDSATELLLNLCELSDDSLEVIVDAICEREKKFEFVDISSNDTLTRKSITHIEKLIKSGKVEDLNIRSIPAITQNKICMEKITEIARKSKVMLYIDDQSRAEIQIKSDTELSSNSIFKRRDMQEVTDNLILFLSDFAILSKVIPKLTPFMLHSINDILGEFKKNPVEEKEEINYSENIISSLKHPKILKDVVFKLPLFLRYKIVDIIRENKFSPNSKPDIQKIWPSL